MFKSIFTILGFGASDKKVTKSDNLEKVDFSKTGTATASLGRILMETDGGSKIEMMDAGHVSKDGSERLGDMYIEIEKLKKELASNKLNLAATKLNRDDWKKKFDSGTEVKELRIIALEKELEVTEKKLDDVQKELTTTKACSQTDKDSIDWWHRRFDEERVEVVKNKNLLAGKDLRIKNALDELEKVKGWNESLIQARTKMTKEYEKLKADRKVVEESKDGWENIAIHVEDELAEVKKELEIAKQSETFLENERKSWEEAYINKSNELNAAQKEFQCATASALSTSITITNELKSKIVSGAKATAEAEELAKSRKQDATEFLEDLQKSKKEVAKWKEIAESRKQNATEFLEDLTKTKKELEEAQSHIKRLSTPDKYGEVKIDHRADKFNHHLYKNIATAPVEVTVQTSKAITEDDFLSDLMNICGGSKND
jgi:chromosome segregation ATPase